MANERMSFLRVTFYVLLALLLSGCEEAMQKYSDPNYVPSAQNLTRIVNEWPDDDPLKPTAQAVALERFMTAQAHESAAEAAELQQQREQQAAAEQYRILTAEARMTQEAHRRELEQKWQWATQQAANATQVYESTRAGIAATATERAFRVTGTAVMVAQQATSTAQKLSQDATATSAAWNAQSTATAQSHTATAVMAHATMTRQAEKREQTLGVARDYGLPILVAGAVAVVGLHTLRDVLARPVQYERSILGDFHPLAFKDGQGGWTLVDLDRQPGHVTRVLPDGEVEAPRVRSAGQEERTTARDQMTDMNTRPKIGQGHKGNNTPELPVAEPPEAPAPGLRSVRMLRRLEHADQAGYLPRPLLESIEADWEVER